MSLDHYNRSFDEFIEVLENEEETRTIRLESVINQINQSHYEWETTFRELLRQSQELSNATLAHQAAFSKVNQTNSLEKPVQAAPLNLISQNAQPKITKPPVSERKENVENGTSVKENTTINQPKAETQKPDKPALGDGGGDEPETPQDPKFSNIVCVKEFIRYQQLLAKTRESTVDIDKNPILKSCKNDLILFIRTQINSISNSDSEHLDSKVRMLSSLFHGNKVNFQGRMIDAAQHSQGQLFAMDFAAQSFVTVGTRLVNSVPAIAISMATVINGICKKSLPIFGELLIGHLQERCPYLVPMYAARQGSSDDKDSEVKFKIACGYQYDSKTKILESEDKYLTRMRSLVLIYACVTVQEKIEQSWTWLASFLSLKPQPVITATVLQAFLQESSKKLSATYGRQYGKLLCFIKTSYLRMIEDVTPKTSDRQSLIKLKNMLSDDSLLIAAPSGNSLFGSFRFN